MGQLHKISTSCATCACTKPPKYRVSVIADPSRSAPTIARTIASVRSHGLRFTNPTTLTVILEALLGDGA